MTDTKTLAQTLADIRRFCAAPDIDGRLYPQIDNEQEHDAIAAAVDALAERLHAVEHTISIAPESPRQVCEREGIAVRESAPDDVREPLEPTGAAVEKAVGVLMLRLRGKSYDHIARSLKWKDAARVGEIVRTAVAYLGGNYTEDTSPTDPDELAGLIRSALASEPPPPPDPAPQVETALGRIARLMDCVRTPMAVDRLDYAQRGRETCYQLGYREGAAAAERERDSALERYGAALVANGSLAEARDHYRDEAAQSESERLAIAEQLTSEQMQHAQTRARLSQECGELNVMGVDLEDARRMASDAIAKRIEAEEERDEARSRIARAVNYIDHRAYQSGDAELLRSILSAPEPGGQS